MNCVLLMSVVERVQLLASYITIIVVNCWLALTGLLLPFPLFFVFHYLFNCKVIRLISSYILYIFQFFLIENMCSGAYKT